MAASFGSRIAAGAAWMVVFKLLDRSIGIVSVVILAHLLVPTDFGLVAMATAIIAIIELLSAFNFDMALIQSQQATRAHYDTAWTLNVAMAAVCALLVAAAALPAGAFYGDSRLGPIMLWLSLATWIRGFENVGVVAFRKELQLDREFQLLLTKRIGVFLATISIALATRSYWALVLGILAGSIGGVVLSYLFHPFRPRFDLTARGELLHFSKWLVFSNVINTLASRAADLIIGKSLGPGPLGLFNLAHEISHLPSTELSAPVNRAVYPGYAKVASDPARLTAQFLDVLGLTALLTTPVAVGIAVVAPLLVPLLLGDAWSEAVPLMKILALSGLLASLRTNAGYVFLALGRSELLTVMTAVRFAVGVPALVFGTIYFGAKGAAWTILGTSIVMLPVTHWFMHRVLRIRWTEHASVLWRPAVAAAGMYLLVREYLAWTEQGFAASNAVLALASAVVLGVAVYVSFTGMLWAVSGLPQSAEARVVTAITSMNLSGLVARCVQVTPSKLHVAFPLLIMGVLYWLSSLPGTPLPDDPAIYAVFYWVPPSVQNALHVPAYATLAWAWCWALGAWLRVPVARAIGACMISSVYGVFDEWHQSFVPGRYASLTDVTLDVTGAVLGILLVAWIGSRARTIKPQINIDEHG